ncbi:hypothetical protein RND71_024142 [Anisodus tanguticus]|uniref:cysteine synthase n=1 Tax=Anisodus tanguticus TaxID=243964 RepID=A0AAE1RP17_9SOLA|nr:hypothetical protein RND71_024142 [Anisodus tanguticus]
MAPVRTAAAASLLSVAIISYFLCKTTQNKYSQRKKLQKRRNGLVAAIGNTPLIRINSLSDATGYFGESRVLESWRGSVKDRVAVKIIEEALESGALAEGGVVTEGSAGSTAISLATVAPAYGCRCHVVIPDDAAMEKHKEGSSARRRALEASELLSTCRKENQINASDSSQINGHSISEEKQNMNFSSECKGGFFADQFENLANFRSHYEGTGPEIWEQTGGKLDAFIAAAGTGGTVAGVSQFLKDKNSNIKCFLIDPPGSGLYNKITSGVMYTREEAEGRRLKNPFDTITEGIGINRLTENFMMTKLDGAFRSTDIEAVEMSRYLLKNDGLFIGSSSAMNCVGAVRVAKALGSGHPIVTILCDSGMRHLSKFHNAEYLSEHELTPSATGLEFLGLS